MDPPDHFVRQRRQKRRYRKHRGAFTGLITFAFPPPTDVASGYSGATLIDGASRGTTEAWNSPTKEAAADYGNGPRIRLRVNRPKISSSACAFALKALH